MGRFSLLMTLLLGLSSVCVAAEPFEFKQIAACDSEHDPYSPDKLTADRSGDRLVITGWSGVTCGEIPTKPEVVPDWGTLTLRLQFKAVGPLAVCRCTSKFQFVLAQDVPAGRTIYLIKNGKGAAHVVAP
jgi:hypothetical protein